MAMTDRPSELKACPFCGSTSVSESQGETGDGKPWPYIECEECGASAEPDVWNRRALDAAPADPAVSAGDDIWTCPLPTHWRAALYEARELQEWITTQQAEWIEQRAIELAKEQSRGR
jgi:hypothetical protein